MEFLISRDELVRALNRVNGIVQKKSTTPILSAVLIDAVDGAIRMTATDKALTYVGNFVANVTKTGRIAVDAANLSQIVKVLPQETVSISLSDNERITIKCGKSVYKLAALNANDFPPVPSFDADSWLKVDANDLRQIIDHAAFAIADDDNKYGLNGAHFDHISTSVGNYLRMVGTDGNRLNYSQVLYEGELTIGKRMLLPKRGVEELRRLIDSMVGTVEIGFAERCAVIRFEGTAMHVRLLEAEFPDYKAVIPERFKRTATVAADELLESLRRVAIFAVDGAHSFRCEFKNDTLTMSARRLDVGDAREEMTIDYTGEPLVIGFNVTFLMDVLKAVGRKRVKIQMGDILSPAIVVPTDNDDDKEGCLFVVMPVRLD